MASVKGHFVFWLFIIGLPASAVFGASQDIPDNKVYTDVTKTFIRNTTGVLSCRFRGTPLAVYWKKGSDPTNPSLISWFDSEKSGPRYEDGSFDIDENYSLVIKDVRNKDAGRYICRVSNYEGTLIHNFTDVTITDIALKTEATMSVQMGQLNILPCQVNIRPMKVSWLKSPNEVLVFMDLSRHVPSRGGPGYNEGLFNITKEYSLVIYDVTIQHEDKYFCAVTDYDNGNIYQDATVLKVFAYPREPFPFIEECPTNSSSTCTLRIQSDTTLTCLVEEYYPSIELYFVHGSERVEPFEIKEWNNNDGTINKRIKIESDGIGDTSFECVATEFLGQNDSRSMTIHLIRDVQKSHVAVAVVVTVILISAVVIIAVFVFKRKKTRSKRKYKRVHVNPKVDRETQRGKHETVDLFLKDHEETERGKHETVDLFLKDHEETERAKGKKVHVNPKDNQEIVIYLQIKNALVRLTEETERDLISYIEMWMLVKYAREQNVSKNLVKVLQHLPGREACPDTLQADEDYYQEMCKWKAEYTGTCQREAFFDLCRDQGLEAAVDQLKEYSDSTRALTEDDLEHILWHIGEIDLIIGLLKQLGAIHEHDEHVEELKAKGKREVVEGAKNILKSWRDLKNTGNQEVMLSQALEMIRFSPNDNDFFRIPEAQKCGLKKDEMKTLLLPKVTSRHCKELVKAMMDLEAMSHVKVNNNKDVCIDDVIEQNSTALFYSHHMIEDWWAEQNCSHYEKRCSLRRAANGLQGTDALEWYEDKLEQIVKLVPQPQLIQLWKALHITYTSGDLADEGKRLEVMHTWKEDGSKPEQQKDNDLSRALKSIAFDDLLSRRKGNFIYQAEVVDMALDLIMEDFRHFAHALGISKKILTSYRQPFHASHLNLGTISLALQLLDMTVKIHTWRARTVISSILDKSGYQNVSKRFKFASEPSYGELFAIAEAVAQDDKAKVDAGSPVTTGEMKSEEESNNDVIVENERSSSNDDGKEGDLWDGHLKPAVFQDDKTEVNEGSHATNGEKKQVQGRENVGKRQLPVNDDEEKDELQADLRETPQLVDNLTSTGKEEKENNDCGEDVNTINTVDDKEPVKGIENEIVEDAGMRKKRAIAIQRMLKLTEKDIPDRNVLTVVKFWKERICPGLIDHRVVFAEGLLNINKAHLVPEVINGKYHSRKTNIHFIKDMLDGMDKDRRTSLRRLLKIKEKKEGITSSSDDDLSGRICEWVANWTKGMESSMKNYVKNAARVKEMSQRHRDFNDELVVHGFLHLAKEIMNIEQYW